MDNAYVIITFHGTVVARRANTKTLVARGALMSITDAEYVYASDELALIPLDDSIGFCNLLSKEESFINLTSVEIRHLKNDTMIDAPSAFILKSGEKYLCASDDLSIRFAGAVAREWEYFIFIRIEQINLLRYISSMSWYDIESKTIISYSRIRLVSGFTFMLGENTTSLRNLGEIDITLVGDTLEMICENGKKKTFTKVGQSAKAGRDRELPSKFIWIKPLGQTANRALQYLAAERIRRVVPGLEIRNVDLPEFHRQSYHEFPNSERILRLTESISSFDLPGLADCLERGVVDGATIETYPFALDLFPDLSDARTALGEMSGGEDARGFGPDEIVCHIRAGDILAGDNPLYFVLPAEYYRMLEERTGLRLVFVGQLHDNVYIESLRRALPEARFVMGAGAAHDFNVLRRSVNIALSLSTFAWLAAWLSDAKKIVLPIGGLFNPMNAPHLALLPVDDLRYEYVLLPSVSGQNMYENNSLFNENLNLIALHSRPIARDQVRKICSRAIKTFKPTVDISGFDPEYYVSRYSDLPVPICNGNISNPLQHFLDSGAREGRAPFDFDPDAYLLAYPDAAMAIAEGRFAGPFDHFIHEGRDFGYKPRPELKMDRIARTNSRTG